MEFAIEPIESVGALAKIASDHIFANAIVPTWTRQAFVNFELAESAIIALEARAVDGTIRQINANAVILALVVQKRALVNSGIATRSCETARANAFKGSLA